MKKNLVFLLALAMAGGSVQQSVVADDLAKTALYKTALYLSPSVSTNIVDGVVQAKRLNAYASTDEMEIKKKAKHAMISSTIALIANFPALPIILARHFNAGNDLTPFALGCTSLTAINATTVFRHLFQLYNSFKMYKNAENIAQKNKNLTPEQIEQVKQTIALLRKTIKLNQAAGPGNILPFILSCGLLLAGIQPKQEDTPTGPHLIILGTAFPVLSMATDVIEPVAEKMFYKTQYEK